MLTQVVLEAKLHDAFARAAATMSPPIECVTTIVSATILDEVLLDELTERAKRLLLFGKSTVLRIA
jgi:hypothetical protein